MHPFLEVAATGLTALRLHPLRNLASLLALVAVLTPYLVGIALARGIEAEADAPSPFAADLVVTATQFGRPVPIPLETQARLLAIDGVTGVTPRIVGEVALGKDNERAILVGLPPARFDAWAGSIDGELPRSGRPHELVVGCALAQRLKLKVGAMLPPFYHNEQGEYLSRVVGVFKPGGPLWQTNLILTTLDTAADVFARDNLATDLLVTCRPGSLDEVARAIRTANGYLRVRAGAEDMLALSSADRLHREGAFHLHFILAFVVGILVLLVTSGVGLTERRREIGILKATGWQTDEVLLRGLTESLALSLGGAALVLVLAWLWLEAFKGVGVTGLFFTGPALDFPVPYRLTPAPALLGFIFSFVLVMTGTVYSSWTAARTPPREAMR